MKKAVKWGSYFYNLVRIHGDHELQKNGAYYPMDPVSHRGLSMRELRKRVDVPATAVAGNAQGGGEENHIKAASRDIATLASDILIDSVLISSITDTRKYIIGKLGDKIALSVDFSLVSIWDHYQGRTRAFKSIVTEKDLHAPHAPKPDSTGFIAGAFAEVEVEEGATPQSFMAASDGSRVRMAFKEKVRIVFAGYQVIFDCCAAPGQLDRGEAPNQLSRVLTFNKEVKSRMEKIGFPSITEIAITSHSIGISNALLSRFYWRNHRDLMHSSAVSHITAIEPIGASIALRKSATMIAALKIMDGRQTDIASVVKELAHSLDVAVISNKSALRNFHIHYSPLNNRLVGERGLIIESNRPPNLITTLRNHMCANIAREMYDLKKTNPVSVDTGRLNMLSHDEIALEPPSQGRASFRDRMVRLAAYALLAWYKATGQYDARGDERHFATTVRDIGEALSLKETIIEQVITAAQVREAAL